MGRAIPLLTMIRWGLPTALVLFGCGGVALDELDAGADDDADADIVDENDLDGGGHPDAMPPPEPASFTRYPHDAVRSPVTAAVAERLRAIATRDASRDDTVFMKVGASGTVSKSFLFCFAGQAQPQYRLELDGRDELLATLEHFRGGDAAGDTPFDRATLAAAVGKTASWVLAGTPSPLARETELLDPRFAFVNYGTNDMELGATYASALPGFFENLSRVLDRLEEGGVVPIVTGLNPRADRAEAARWVPTYDAVTRALAEARQLPYVSLYRASGPLPGMGLASDGLHGNAFSDGGTSQPCVFTAAGLRFNYNVRNLLSLEALDGARRAVVDDEDPSEPGAGPALQGDGSRANPFVIDRLPFSHAYDTRRGVAEVDRWSCGAQDESGPEIHYRLQLTEATPLRAIVLDRADTDVDVHLADAQGSSCSKRADVVCEQRLPSGRHHVVVDSFVSSSGKDWAGAYLLVVLACEPGDPRCD